MIDYFFKKKHLFPTLMWFAQTYSILKPSLLYILWLIQARLFPQEKKNENKNFSQADLPTYLHIPFPPVQLPHCFLPLLTPFLHFSAASNARRLETRADELLARVNGNVQLLVIDDERRTTNDDEQGQGHKLHTYTPSPSLSQLPCPKIQKIQSKTDVCLFPLIT